MCAGLAAAHDKGVLHRDLKPANVMIDGRGQARITDFGLAVNARAGGSPADLAGTLPYMAPERFHGTPATVQSDLYGLGLILYETYTGKPAFKANSLLEWERAHSDSTPTNPSELAVDVEPAVERAILRCLAKDPARRPASAAQVASALPGGDPLAAAIAAGETPSPEQVAASGEEGTLPRAKAWLWLAACLVALAVVFAIASKVSLANLIPLQDPAVLKAKAQTLLRDLAYRDEPLDTLTWNEVYLAPGGGFAIDASDIRGPILFAYRQSSQSLLRIDVLEDRGCSIPTPTAIDDACVRLDARDGRLMTLRVGGVNLRAGRDRQASSAVNWKPLLAAAALDETQVKPLESIWSPAAFQVDAQAAWQGSAGGRAYRVDAAAYRGRASFFSVRSDALDAGPQTAAPTDVVRRTLRSVAGVAIPVLMLLLIAALAAMARHNLRMGRGDRKGAFRVAMLVLVGSAISSNLTRHWGADPGYVLNVLVLGQGPSLFMAMATWLYYLGFEPYVRRHWPHLLVTSSRLLDGLWRDPLVGRSVLIGVVAGVVLFGVSPLGALLSHMPGLGPVRSFYTPASLLGVDGFVRDLVGSVTGMTFNCLEIAGLLLISRVIFRRDGLAWTVVALAAFLMLFVALGTGGLAPVLAVSAAAIGSLILLASIRAGGLLAALIQLYVWRVLATAPLTLDASRWYAWRSWFVVALVVAIAIWGFRNVLGKQSAFPAAALDG